MHSECSKVVIINLEINIFLIINQQPKFCAIFSSKINPDAHFGTKINTFTVYKGDLGGGGVNSPQKPKKCKKNGGFTFLQQILHTGRKDISCNNVDSGSCQGVKIFFY